MGDKMGENPAALRAAVFFAILEKPEGGVQTPLPAGRGLMHLDLILTRPYSNFNSDYVLEWNDWKWHWIK